MSSNHAAAPAAVLRSLRLFLVAAACLWLVGPAGARPAGEPAVGVDACAAAFDAAGAGGGESPEQMCLQVQIGLSASPNPTPAGGIVTFVWSVSPETDCWDNLGHSAWGGFSFQLAVLEAFTWTVWCTGSGIESSSLPIGVEGGGGGGGGGGGAVPAIISAPSISGLPEVTQTLTADRGTWTNTPTSYGYRWKRSGDLLDLGTGQALTLTSAHLGYQIRVDVQACNGTGCGSWASSDWSAAVTEPAPEYDPAYAEGSDLDESWLIQTCSGRACSALKAFVFVPAVTAATSVKACYRVGASVYKSNSVTRIWRMDHSVSYCVGGNKLLRVWDRVVDGEILIPAWARVFYPWDWEVVADSRPAVGVSSSRSYAKLRFQMCGTFRIGPLCFTNEPWIEITLSGSGAATCNTSAGRVRNCSEPR